jgi:hypothetical protein
MQRQITSTQLQNIQIDYGMVYVDFGLAGERRLGPSKGGATFIVTADQSPIEYDGQVGPTKGLHIINAITAKLKIASLDISMDDLAVAMPWASYSASKITAEQSNVGIVPDAAYLTNLTMFGKKVGGDYVKIVLFNALNTGDFELACKPKDNGQVTFEFTAHWDPTDATDDLFTVEEVETMGADTTPPTVVTVPADGAGNVVVTDNLTATFSEAIRQADVNSNNFILMKVSDGTIVAGTLTYTPASYLVTFDPTSSLEAGTAYIWVITGVRDLAGNTMVQVVKNFTTAA